MSAFVTVSVAEGIVDSDHRSVLLLRERDLDGATGMEAFVEVHAVVVEDAFEQATFEDVASTDEQQLSPAVFHTNDILVFGEGVGIWWCVTRKDNIVACRMAQSIITRQPE